MKDRIYQGVQLSKKESELVQWLQKGDHSWHDAFYMYANRRKVKAFKNNRIKERTWFNRTLANLHTKGLCKNIPFVIYGGLPWRNPGITSNKASFVALTLQQDNLAESEMFKKVI